MSNIIKMNHVSFSTPEKSILKNINFEVPANSGFALLGPNGSGKTTSIRVIGGLISPDNGEVLVNGEKVASTNSHIIRENIGFQLDGSLYERLTAEENLKLWGQLYGKKGPKLDQRVDELLELFNLGSRRKSKVGEFSKGMKQQVAFCRAIISEPSILILDEPTSGLSPEVAENVISYINDFRSKNDCTVLLCTHELFGLEKLVDHVCVINDGITLTYGNVNSLTREYWPEKKYRLIVPSREAKNENLWNYEFWEKKTLASILLIIKQKFILIPNHTNWN